MPYNLKSTFGSYYLNLDLFNTSSNGNNWSCAYLLTKTGVLKGIKTWSKLTSEADL